MHGPLYDLLLACTVRLRAAGRNGTGFFVAPGLVLTCAHVVNVDQPAQVIHAEVRGRTLPASLVERRADPYPDVALLRVEPTHHPYVQLDPDVQPHDDVFCFGYPRDYSGGDSVLAVYEGPAYVDTDKACPMLKLGGGQVVAGLSGAPVLNLRTKGVCGVVKSTRDAGSDLGGRAVPIHIAMDALGLGRLRNEPWAEAVQLQSRQRPAAQPARVDLVVYDKPENTFNRPPELIGRQSLLRRVDQLLDRGRTVLLHGLGGAGKTALAATVADDRLRSHGGSYAWLQAQHADTGAVLDAFLRCLANGDVRDELLATTGDAKTRTVRDLLAASGLGLIVLDDIWNGRALHRFLSAVPAGLSILITSRRRFAIDESIEVAELSLPDALRLLTIRAAGADRMPDAAAVQLCDELGRHPYAIEIAGAHLRQRSRSPAELLEAIRAAPHDLTMPEDFAAEGKESVARLLDASFSAITDATSVQVLLSFGVLFSLGATVELLAEHLAVPCTVIRTSLATLTGLSLVKRLDDSPYYSVHELTGSYLRARVADPEGDSARALATVDKFVSDHSQDHDALKLAIENILGAAAYAAANHDRALLSIVSSLAEGGYADQHGHGQAYLPLIEEALELIEERADGNDLIHLFASKKGNVHYHCGEFDRAELAYRRALESAPTTRRQAVVTAVLGKTLTRMGRHTEAHDLFTEAYALAADDDACLVLILEQESDAASREGDIQRVKKLSSEAVMASRRIGDRSTEGYSLCNLGSAEFDLGIQVALAYHEQARTIAEEIGDDVLLALAHRDIAMDHHAMEDCDMAAHHLEIALELYRKLGHRDSERYLLGVMSSFGYVSRPESRS